MAVIIPNIIPIAIPAISSCERSPFTPVALTLSALPASVRLSLVVLAVLIPSELSVLVVSELSVPFNLRLLTIGSDITVCRVVTTEVNADGRSDSVNVTTSVCARAVPRMNGMTDTRARSGSHGGGWTRELEEGCAVVLAVAAPTVVAVGGLPPLAPLGLFVVAALGVVAVTLRVLSLEDVGVAVVARTVFVLI